MIFKRNKMPIKGPESKQFPDDMSINTGERDTVSEPGISTGGTLDEKACADLMRTLTKYKDGKKTLENKIISNEQWWKLRQWREICAGNPEDMQPASAWLWNCIVSKHADIMDGYPEPIILPKAQDDKEEANRLSKIIPVILDECDYEETYSSLAWYAFKHGVFAQGVFWDPQKNNGLGGIVIKQIDILNLYWEPGITDLQRSHYVFNVCLEQNETLKETYPDIKFNGSDNSLLAKYLYDDAVDTSDTSLVVDAYYKKRNSEGKTVLHMAKIIGNKAVYCSEDIPQLRERGIYDDGKYPFVIAPLFPVAGSLAGLGLTDIGRDAQMQIDLIDQALLKNTLAAARPRWMLRSDGVINEEEYSDWTKEFIHVEGNLDETNIKQIPVQQLSGNYITIRDSLINELKETTSNRDVNNGGTSAGITAASAIAALQESGGKVSRDNNKAFYRAFREVVKLVIERIRQFLDIPSQYRITGELGQTEFVEFSNEGLKPQPQTVMGQITGYRLPEFDIEVSAAKATAYTKMAQNELMLQFLGLGFFNPANSTQALSCLEGMDFDHKSELEARIKQNGTVYDKLVRMQQIALSLAQKCDPQFAEQLLAQIQGEAAAQAPTLSASNIDLNPEKENAQVTKSRRRTQESTQV